LAARLQRRTDSPKANPAKTPPFLPLSSHPRHLACTEVAITANLHHNSYLAFGDCVSGRGKAKNWRASVSQSTQSQRIEDFSIEQLAGIGAALIAYDKTEHVVDLLLSLGLCLSAELALVVTSRINGLEDKIEIVELAAKTLDLPKEARTFLSKSLVEEPGLSTLKGYRDEIARAGEPDEERGKRKTGVLFKPASLQACVKHLEALREELHYFVNIFDIVRKSIN
jgi:hypothetical protein